MRMVNPGLKSVIENDVVHSGDGNVYPPAFSSSSPHKSFRRAAAKAVITHTSTGTHT